MGSVKVFISVLLLGFYGNLSAVDFEPPKDIANGSVSGISCIDAGKINNDEYPDILVVEGGKHAGGRVTFAWFQSPSNTQGNWTRRNISHNASLRSFLGAAKLADMDNDGDLDIVVSSDNHSGGSKQADVFVFINPGGSATGTWNHHKLNNSTSNNPHVRAAVLERKEKQHVAWAFQRENGGRGFSTTGAHYHKNWNNDSFRTMVLNGILWTAKIEVPESGTKSDKNPVKE